MDGSALEGIMEDASIADTAAPEIDQSSAGGSFLASKGFLSSSETSNNSETLRPSPYAVSSPVSHYKSEDNCV